MNLYANNLSAVPLDLKKNVILILSRRETSSLSVMLKAWAIWSGSTGPHTTCKGAWFWSVKGGIVND